MTDQTYEVLHETLNALYGEENPSQEDICAYVASYATKVMDAVGVDRHYEAQPNTFLKLEGTDFIGYSIFENIEWDGEALVVPYIQLVEKVAAPTPNRKRIEVLVDGAKVGEATDFKETDRRRTPAYEINRQLFTHPDRALFGEFLQEYEAEFIETGANANGDLLPGVDQFDPMAAFGTEFPPSPAPRDLRNLRYGEYVPELDPFLMERVLKSQTETRPIYTMGSPNLTATVPGKTTHYVDDYLVDTMVWEKVRNLQTASAPGGLEAVTAARRNWNFRNDQAQREITNGEF